MRKFLFVIICLVLITLSGCIKNEPKFENTGPSNTNAYDSLNGTGNENSDVDVNSDDSEKDEDSHTNGEGVPVNNMKSDIITFMYDGVPIELKDIKGDAAEAFISNGTVYIPASAFGEAVGKPVTWDGSSKTLYIGKNPNAKNYLFNVCPPINGNYEEFTGGKTLEIRGKKYTNGFRLNWNDGYMIVPLEGRYSKLFLKVGHIDGSSMDSGSFTVTLDNVTQSEVYVFNPEDPIKDIEVDLKGALTLRIDGDYGISRYGFVEVELKEME